MLFSISLAFTIPFYNARYQKRNAWQRFPFSNDNFLIFHLPDIRHLFQTAQHILKNSCFSIFSFSNRSISFLPFYFTVHNINLFYSYAILLIISWTVFHISSFSWFRSIFAIFWIFCIFKFCQKRRTCFSCRFFFSFISYFLFLSY